jgi:hypothetical protein
VYQDKAQEFLQESRVSSPKKVKFKMSGTQSKATRPGKQSRPKMRRKIKSTGADPEMPRC